MAERHFHPKDMLRFADVIDVLGISERTMWRRLRDKTMTEVPPFKMVGRQRRWRYDYLIAFRDGKTSLRGEVSEYPLQNEQPPADPISLNDIAMAVEDWKRSELWKRAEAIITERAFSPIETERLQNELLIIDPDDKIEDRQRWHVEITKAVSIIAKSLGFEIIIPLNPINAPETAIALKHLLISAYSEVVASEVAWRKMDWTTMPKVPPVAQMARKHSN